MHDHFMDAALAEARNALSQGEFPVGCVIVQDAGVIARGSREGTSGNREIFNEIAHAEMVCLENAGKRGAAFDPARAALYCTMEPCLMCFGAILIYGIKRVVYAFEDPMGGALHCDLKNLPPLYSNREIEIVPNVMRKESLALFYRFFTGKDNLYWRDSLLEKYTIEQAAAAG